MSRDSFILQRRVHKLLLKSRPTVTQGMALTLETIKAAGRAKQWALLDGFDWSPGQAAFETWLELLFRTHPPPDPVGGLWIEVPDVLLNSAFTSISAYKRFDPVSPRFGVDEGRTWPIDETGSTLNDGLHDLPEVEHALARLDWRDQSLAIDDHALLEPGVHTLVHAYITLLVLNAIPRLSRKQWLNQPGGLGVTVGWAAGDIDPVGTFTPAGWAPVRRATAAGRRARTTPEMLDPSSFSFDINSYIAARGDPNARNKQGRLILELVQCSDTRVILALLALGADVNLRDSYGWPVFASFLGGDPELLRAMLDAGADLNAPELTGRNVIHLAVGDGRCTRANIEILLAAGAELNFVDSGGQSALSLLAGHSCEERAWVRQLRSQIECLTSLGVDINHRNNRGVTPLWTPLMSMVKELERTPGWKSGAFLRERWPGVSYFGNYHKTAMLFLDAGADPRVRLEESPHPLIPDNATPLMVRRYDQPSLFKAMLDHGADPLAVSKEGKTALEYAKRAAASRQSDAEGAAKVVALLERAMRRATAAAPASNAPNARPSARTKHVATPQPKRASKPRSKPISKKPAPKQPRRRS